MKTNNADFYEQLILLTFKKMLNEQLESYKKEFDKNGPNSTLAIYHSRRIQGLRTILLTFDKKVA